MSTAFGPTDAFDRAIDPVLQILRPEQALEIANYRGNASLQGRIERLALKANEGELSDDELAEYEGYAQANRFLAVLQMMARKVVAPNPRRTSPP